MTHPRRPIAVYTPHPPGYTAEERAKGHEKFKALDYGKRTLPRADPSSTPLPRLPLPDLEAATKALTVIPTDDYRLPSDGRSRPVTALVFHEKALGEMCAMIAKGFTLADIAEYHGLDPQFLYNAYANDTYGIRKAFDKAALDCKLHHLTRVHEGAINYQSSTWFLERKFRDEFGKEQTVNVRPAGQAKKTVWDLGDGRTLEF